MPRKRTTRLQPPKKPVQKETTLAECSENDRQNRSHQLKFFLEDYDGHVRKQLKDIEDQKKAFLSFIRIRMEKAISDIPQEIRDMTLEDFAMCGGTIEAAQAHVRQMKLAGVHNMKWSSLEEIKEEGSEKLGPQTAQETVGRIKKQTAKALAQTATSSRAKRFCDTPANLIGRPLPGQLPMITPKFDPSLPLKPENIRTAKPGEVMMSLSGSPLRVEFELPTPQAVCQQWAHLGLDLSPNCVENMLQSVAAEIKQKHKLQS